MQPLNERLRAHYQSLSPQERRVADFILDHYDDLISYNSAELARVSGVSKPTVSRLFKRLGYSGYKALRDELRALRQSGVPLADARGLADGDTLPARHYQQELANLNQCLAGLDARRLGEAAAALAGAGQVLIVGQRNAYPVALHLRQQLIQARGQVRLAPQPGQTLAEELVDLTPADVVLVVAFRRRPRLIAPLLKSLRQRKIPVVLLCEPQARALPELARWHFPVPLDSLSAFDSYAAAMSLASLLANAVLHEVLADGRRRIHEITDLYDDLDELEKPSP
ncbi:MurR/RpiR family transcriptional regulator [Alloalcanivorax profundimaris]|uniref:MurR/RpiR family transcriptional regulator n=1 Tax=Alloalcanivorax profundimaris TaxID=2735259 RepID=UPI0018870606|nr:MurR/RpiR family transcriptional regulator [Alloalcanivorax profundimaris]MBF1803697.1 MurR/RpiR family transcriptional regulator [Alloalcanivorax profundimaris]